MKQRKELPPPLKGPGRRLRWSDEQVEKILRTTRA
jgi:hypothetical protein